MTIEQLSKEMSELGIRVDVPAVMEHIDLLNMHQEELSERLIKAISVAMKITADKVNLNSTRLMASFIYDYLEAPVIKVTKGKKEPSLDGDTLEELSFYSPLIKDYVEWRSLGRNCSLLTNIIKSLNGDGIVRSTFNPNGTVSGRFTSVNPNMQQIPPDFRKFFVAREGHKLYTLDLSQAEYHLAFILAGTIPPNDIHTMVAEQLGIERKVAKIVNLGILYGMTAFGLGKLLKISEEEAGRYISVWLSTNQTIARLRMLTVGKAISGGYVEMPNGRKVYDRFDTEGVRAFNILIQGTLSDIIKQAMLDIEKYLKAEFQSAHVLLTEHDELVIEVPENVTKLQLLRIKDMMANVCMPNGHVFSFNVTAGLNDCWTKN